MSKKLLDSKFKNYYFPASNFVFIGNERVPGGPRGLQIRSAPATVGTGGFDSHTFPLLFSKWN